MSRAARPSRAERKAEHRPRPRCKKRSSAVGLEAGAESRARTADSYIPCPTRTELPVSGPRGKLHAGAGGTGDLRRLAIGIRGRPKPVFSAAASARLSRRRLGQEAECHPPTAWSTGRQIQVQRPSGQRRRQRTPETRLLGRFRCLPTRTLSRRGRIGVLELLPAIVGKNAAAEAFHGFSGRPGHGGQRLLVRGTRSVVFPTKSGHTQTVCDG